MSSQLPIRDQNSVLEDISELYFKQKLPREWITDKPRDFGVDLIVSIVQHNQVTGLNFSVQLKSTKKIKNNPSVSLKTSTINFLLNKLEPVIIVLFVEDQNVAYWKWLKMDIFDFSNDQVTHTLKFDVDQTLDNIDWTKFYQDVQRVFKIQKHLLTSLEYDLFSKSELETKAWAHYFTKNLQEASIYFKKLLETERSALTLLALAQCEYQLYDYRNALMHINQGLDLEKSPDLLTTKASILAEDGIQNNDFYKLKEAEGIFETLFNQSPSAVNAYNYANTLSSLNQTEKAEELYIKAVTLKPDYAEAWKNLGQIYYKLGKHKKELQCYNKALKINPELAEAKISKGITLSSIYQKHEEGIKEMISGIEIKPEVFIQFPLIYYWMSKAHFLSNDISEAIRWANKGLNHYPGNYHIRDLKAWILIENLDNPEIINEAVVFFEEGRRIHPKDSLNFYYWCTAISKTGEKEKVITEISKWLNINLSLNINTEFLSDFALENLLLIPLHWRSVAVYFETYNIKDYNSNFDKKLIVEAFLDYFQISRALFVSMVDEGINHKKITQVYIETCIKKSFYPLPLKNMAKMITAPKDKPEHLSHQLSEVITKVAMIYFVEISRSVGFFLGKSKLRPTKIVKLIDPNLYKEFLLSTSEILYTILD